MKAHRSDRHVSDPPPLDAEAAGEREPSSRRQVANEAATLRGQTYGRQPAGASSDTGEVITALDSAAKDLEAMARFFAHSLKVEADLMEGEDDWEVPFAPDKVELTVRNLEAVASDLYAAVEIISGLRRGQ